MITSVTICLNILSLENFKEQTVKLNQSNFVEVSRMLLLIMLKIFHLAF